MLTPVDFLTEFGVRTTAQTATPACDGNRPQPPQDTAFQISASDYTSIDGDILLGDDFPEQWCMLSSVNCNPSQAGTLMYYEDGSGFGYSMDISGGQLTFLMRDGVYTAPGQLCDNSWNQFSVCYDGGTLVMTKDCANAVVMGRPSDPGLSTVTGTLTIFNNGSSSTDYSVSHHLLIRYSSVYSNHSVGRLSRATDHTNV